jgi:Dynamin family
VSAPISSRLLDEVVVLLEDARAAAPDPASAESLDEALQRAGEPLRVAIAGRVKAGKSTLLNALVGDELAATDAGECTKIVTWYRNAHTYRVERHLRDGSAHQCTFRRRDNVLEIELDGTPVEDIERLAVWWPSRRLEDVTLVDTPGIGSMTTDMAARTYEFLVGDGDDAPGAADAVLYLLRHLHGTDVRFLEAFHDDQMVSGTPVNALGVLARSDEIGGCRLGAMESARRVADRYQGDPRIRQLCRLVVPVAGLLAQAGATLREDEFRQLASLATNGSADIVEMALTADRFVSPGAGVEVPAEARWDLLERLGLFGVRLSLDLIRKGEVTSSPELASALLRSSGISDLRTALGAQLMGRSQALKARSSLATLNAVFRSGPWPDAGRWLMRVERITSSAHEIVEIQLLTDLWLGDLEVRDDDQAGEMERLLGGLGTTPAARMGLPEDAPADAQQAAALSARERWMRIAEHPLSSARLRSAAREVARTCEGVLVQVAVAAARAAQPQAEPAGFEVGRAER